MPDIAFTGQQILILIAGFAILVFSFIYFWKLRFSALQKLALQTKSISQNIAERNKYKKLQLSARRPLIFLVSGIVSLGFVLAVFHWTFYNTFDVPNFFELEIQEFITIEEPPRTAEKKPEIAPTVKPRNQVIIVPVEVIDSIYKTDTSSLLAIEPTNLHHYKPDTSQALKTTAPVTPDNDIDELFDVVENMPMFPGCNLPDASYEERKLCADNKLLSFIYKEIRYPRIAGTAQIEGTVIVQFVVERDGSISNPEVLRNPGGGLGQEALRIVNLMGELEEKWTPGIMNHRPVRVVMRLPIRFRLAD